MRLHITVIIPCYNSERTIGFCLSSVLNQTYKPIEIIVVDDGSIDSTFETLSEFPVRVIRHGENRGIAASRNTGLENASGDIIAFLDSDCIASEMWLEKVMRYFDAQHIAGVGGRGIELFRGTAINRHRASHGSQTHGLERKYVSMIFGLCFSFRRGALKEIGGFDEYFRTNGEDVDVCLRLHQKGFQLLYDPNIMVFHLREDNLGSYLLANYRAYKFGFYAQVKNLGYSTSTFGSEALKIPLRCISRIRKDLRQFTPSHVVSSFILSVLVSITQILALRAVHGEIPSRREKILNK